MNELKKIKKKNKKNIQSSTASKNSRAGRQRSLLSKSKMSRPDKIVVTRLAVADLGTNSVRLDIYRLNSRSVQLLSRDKTMIRLGDGVYKTGRLSPAGMQRCLRTFVRYRRMMKHAKVQHVVAFGTSALRSSSNAKVMLKAIKMRTGIDVRVISGREEGELIALGIMSNVILPKGRYALVDIGGGSTEVSICLGDKILCCESYRLGANRLQQMFFKTSPVHFQRGKLHPTLALRQYIREKLMPLSARVGARPVQTVIGSSGTIRAASKILKKLGCGDRVISRMDLTGLVGELQLMSPRELRRVPGLEAKRADIIVPGLILLEEIMYALKMPQMKVTEHALREGILQQTLAGL